MSLFHFLWYLGHLRYALLPMATLLFLTFLGSVQAFVFLLVTPAIFDRLFLTLDGVVLLKVVLILLGSLAFQLAVKAGIGVVGSHLNQKVALHLRVNLLRQAFRKEQRFFDKSSNGDVSKRLIVDTESVAVGVQYACLAGLHLLQFGAAAWFFRWREPWFFEIYLALSAAHLLWALPWKLLVGLTARRITQDYGRCYGFMWQAAGNIRLIKLLGLGRKLDRDFAAIQAGVKRHFDWNEGAIAISFVLARPLAYVGYGLAALHCIRGMDDGTYGLGHLAAFTGVFFTIIDYVFSMVEAVGTVLRSAPSAAEMAGLRRQRKEPSGKTRLGDFEQAIEFRGVRFAYGPDREILKGVDLRVPKGTRFGIVGKSGSGKTTVLNLLLKLYDGYRGEILIDGIPLERLENGSLRDRISYLGQDGCLFLGTFRDNVDPTGRLEEGRILEICRRVGLDEVLDKLPQGLATRIHHDGSPLSGGQIQRVFLARVLAKDAPILLLDEMTSNLDPHTEAKILDVVEEFARGRTLITVSHRLEVVSRCDQVLVLHDGHPVQLGAYQHLLREEGGKFRQIFGLPSLELARGAGHGVLATASG